MSLVQDALKRKAEESAAAGLSVTPAPPPPTVRIQEPKVKTKRPQALMVTIISLVVVVLLIALSGVAFHLIRTSTASKHAAASGIIAEEPRTDIEIEESSVLSPAVESSPAPAPVSVFAGSKAKEASIEWPKLKLTGIARSGSQQIAIINGKMLTAGRTASGVIIREVRDAEVVVEYQGVRRVLHVDE
jgi:hypothetical protein